MPRPQPHLMLVACVTSSSSPSSSSSLVSWFNTWLIYRCPLLSAILCVCPWCTQGLWHYTTIFLLCFILPHSPTSSIPLVLYAPCKKDLYIRLIAVHLTKRQLGIVLPHPQRLRHLLSHHVRLRHGSIDQAESGRIPKGNHI